MFFNKHGVFDETLPACEDYDLWLRLLRHHPIGLNPHPHVIKYGGHADQLSKSDALDQYRLHALKKALKTETYPEYINKLTDVLKNKLTIVKNGALKRGNKILLNKIQALELSY